MGSRSFKLCKIALVIVAMDWSRPLKAQAPIIPEPLNNPNPSPTRNENSSEATTSKSISIDPPSKNYDIVINPGKDVYGNQLDPNKTQVKEPWNRLAGGLYASITNSGVIVGGTRISEDTIMRGKSSEFGYGLGAFIDFPNSSLSGSALRFKLGLYKMSFTHNSELKATYPDQLETAATLIHLGGLLKFPLNIDLPLGHVWIGVGGQMNYALSTKRPAAVSEDSRISGTYAFHLNLAAGTEISLNSFNDLSFELDYLPVKGYSLFIGLRTSL